MVHTFQRCLDNKVRLCSVQCVLRQKMLHFKESPVFGGMENKQPSGIKKASDFNLYVSGGI